METLKDTIARLYGGDSANATPLQTPPITNNPVTPAPVTGGQETMSQTISRLYGDSAGAPTPAQSPTVDPITGPDDIGLIESLSRGFSRGLRQEGEFFTNVGALGAQALGDNTLRDNLLSSAADTKASAQSAEFATVPFEQAMDSVGSAARWFAGALGEQVPNIITIIASGGVGGLIGKAAAKKGIKGLTEVGLNKAMKLGTGAGAFAAGAAIETGATVSEQVDATGEINTPVALGAGLVKGALETITPIAVGRASGILGGTNTGFMRLIRNSVDDTGGLAARVGSSFLLTGSMEAATEATQEAVDIAARKMVDENYDMLGEDAKARIVESAVTAFFVGGTFGGAASLSGRRGNSLPENTAPAIASENPYGPAGTNDVTPSPVASEEGSLLSALGGDVTKIKKALSPKADTPTAFVLKSEVGKNSGIVEFRKPEQAAMTSALQGKKGDAKEFIYVQPGKNVDFGEKTALLEDLPDGLNITTEGVSFVKPDTRDEALGKAQEAATLMNLGKKAEAAKVYSEAIDAGFRMEPTGVGFVPVKGLVGMSKANGLKVVQAPLMPSQEDLGVIPIHGGPQGSGVYHIESSRLKPGQTINTPLHEMPAKALTLVSPMRESISYTKPDKDLSKDLFISTISTSMSGSEQAQNIVYPTENRSNLGGKVIPAPSNYLSKNAKNGVATVSTYALARSENLRKTRYPAEVKGNARIKKLITKNLELLIKTFAPGHKVLLAFTQTNSTELGSYIGSSSGKIHKIVLNMNPRPTQGLTKAGQILDTLVHEFGHMLSQIHLNEAVRTNPQLYAEVLNAYRVDAFRVAHLPNAQSHAGFKSAISSSFSTSNRSEQLFVDMHTAKFSNYSLSFEEWFAEQMAKWVQNVTGRPPMSKLERLMKAISVRVNRMFKFAAGKLAKDKSIYEASSAFNAFVAYTQAADKSKFRTFDRLVQDRNSMEVWSKELGVNVIPSEDSSNTGNMMKHPKMKALLSKVEPPVASEGTSMEKHFNVLSLAKDYYNSMVKWGWTVLQLGDKNPHIQRLQEYISLAREWSNEKMAWSSRANETLREWGSLGKEQSDKLSNFIFAIDNMEYLGKDEKPRKPTVAEEQKLLDKYGVTAAGYVTYQRVRGDFDAVLARLKEVIKTNIMSVTSKNAFTQVMELAQVDKEFAELAKQPYFPHARFGNYMVTVRNANGSVVYSAHVEGGNLGKLRGRTPRVVKNEVIRLQKEFPTSAGFTINPDVIPEQSKIFRGMPLAALKLIKEHLGESMSEEQKIWLDQMVIAAAPSSSFRKRLARRKNVPGYSRDAMRAYADYFWHAANHMARISYGQDMQDKLTEFDKETSELGRMGNDVIKRREIVGFLQDHLANLLNPQPDWAQLRSVAFTWWLGFSPASAALNFTQLPLVTAPYLSSRFGDVKTLGALRRAMTGLRKMYGDPEKALRGLTGEKLALQESNNKLLALGLEQNILTESLAVELAGVAGGSVLTRLRHGTKAQRAMNGFASAAGWLFQGSEKINRRVSFAAAIELARKNPQAEYLVELRSKNAGEYGKLLTERGFTVEEATAYLAGRDAVTRTQFEYSQWARPRFMRGRKSVIFTFYMFTQNMLWFTFNSPGNKRMLITMLAMGGLMGMPGAEDLFAIADFLGKKMFGRYFKVEEEIAALMEEAFGENQTGDLLLHGASRVGFGLPAAADMVGVPLPTIDMSGSIGMGNIVPGLPALMNTGRGNFEERLGRATTDIAGASLGIGLNLFQFMSDSTLPLDDPKRWERVVPRALKNVMKAMRFVPPDTATAQITGAFIEPEGRERSRSGNTIIAFDGSDPEQMMEIAMQAMGFNPTRLSREWNNTIAIAEAINYWKLRRSSLMTQYWHTLYTNDPEARVDVLAAISAFNQAAPFADMRITRKTLKSSVNRRTVIMNQREAGVEPTKMYRGIAQQVDAVYPSKNDVILSETVR